VKRLNFMGISDDPRGGLPGMLRTRRGWLSTNTERLCGKTASVLGMRVVEEG
jgi:hypothetical protein